MATNLDQGIKDVTNSEDLTPSLGILDNLLKSNPINESNIAGVLGEYSTQLTSQRSQSTKPQITDPNSAGQVTYHFDDISALTSGHTDEKNKDQVLRDNMYRALSEIHSLPNGAVKNKELKSLLGFLKDFKDLFKIYMDPGLLENLEIDLKTEISVGEKSKQGAMDTEFGPDVVGDADLDFKKRAVNQSHDLDPKAIIIAGLDAIIGLIKGLGLSDDDGKPLESHFETFKDHISNPAIQKAIDDSPENSDLRRGIKIIADIGKIPLNNDRDVLIAGIRAFAKVVQEFNKAERSGAVELSDDSREKFGASLKALQTLQESLLGNSGVSLSQIKGLGDAVQGLHAIAESGSKGGPEGGTRGSFSDRFSKMSRSGSFVERVTAANGNNRGGGRE